MSELDDLTSAFEGFQEAFARNPEAATELLNTGERPSLARYDRVELASMTMAASVILNLDESIVRN